MFFSSVLRYALFLLAPLSFLLTTYLYLYPVFHLCAFPSPEQDARSEYLSTVRQHTPFLAPDTNKIAPFRLLALGDPQLEGESSLYDIVDSVNLPNLKKFWKDALLLDGTRHNPLQRVRHSLHDLIDFFLEDLPNSFEVWRKRLDHIGNDYYLGHIYRTLHWWTKPTHVTVLGDLVGSQWIDDEEFGVRAWRFWNRVFRGGRRVEDELYTQPSGDFQGTLVLGQDAAAWKRRIINVAGNHDIGYAGDLSPDRMSRFTKLFGKANYELRFQLPFDTNTTTNDVENGERPPPEIRLIVLNDMNLDTPASSRELQDETYGFLNDVITSSKEVTRPAHFTLVLTHIPLFKEAGVCVDGPFFDFFDGEFSNGVKEQNHLSMDASKGFLEGVFGMSGSENVPGHGFGRNGVILNGHDHEGCNVYHYINQSQPPEREWKATTWSKALSVGITDEPGVPGLREITVRSMMGDFAGNAGLMSLWFDEEEWDWRFEFVNCGLGTQHIWWLVHIVDLITLGVSVVYGGFLLMQRTTLSISSLNKSVPRKPVQNGNARKEKGSQDRPDIAGVKIALGSNGHSYVSGAGTGSLRKRASKTSLNGGPHSPSSPFRG